MSGAHALKTMGVIPTRYDSSRLPGKALRDIVGKPLIQRVYEAARQAGRLDEIVVATDSSIIAEFCSDASIPVVVTARHPSGSDRLHEVMQRTDADIYVNIQGDEPTIRPEHIDSILGPLLAGEAQVSTLKVRIDTEAAQNPNNVKVVTDCNGRALYFSRWPIPYDRDKSGAEYFKHIGLYGYYREALETFHSLPMSSLEKLEKLEQLRFLENGIPITVLETPHDTVGVDTEADLQQVIAIFRARVGES